MRLSDGLYFAPGIRFSELDLNGPGLVDQFECRIRGFYLEPAKHLAEQGYAFASGLLLVSCVDALARVVSPRSGSRARFKRYVQTKIPSFADRQRANRLWDDFRNGLVHEARIKSGGEFSLEIPTVVHFEPPIFRVNPFLLVAEISNALTCLVNRLSTDHCLRQNFANFLRSDFRVELQDHPNGESHAT